MLSPTLLEKFPFLRFFFKRKRTVLPMFDNNFAKPSGEPFTRWESADADPTVLAQTLRFPYASNLTAPNRFMKSAMSEQLATYEKDDMGKSGIPTEALIHLYEKFGRGGFGVIVTGCIMVNGKDIEAPGNVVIDKAYDSEERRNAFKEWTAATKANGSIFLAQLFHPGKYAADLPHKTNFDANTVTEAQINQLVEEYAYAATYAQECGFDGVELSAAYFFALGQFITDGANTRTDDYGGSLENRSRLIFRIIHAIRMRIRRPNSFVIGLKLFSGNFEPGFDEEAFGDFIYAVEKKGFDYVTITGGHYSFLKNIKPLDKESSKKREHFYQTAAIEIKKNLTRTKLYMNGGFLTLSDMCDAVHSGWTAGISLARPVAAETDLPKRILSGELKAAIKSLIDPLDFPTAQQLAGTQLWQNAWSLEVLDGSNPEHIAQFLRDLEKHSELRIASHEQGSEPVIGYPKTIVEESTGEGPHVATINGTAVVFTDNVEASQAVEPTAGNLGAPELIEEEIHHVVKKQLDNAPLGSELHESLVEDIVHKVERRHVDYEDGSSTAEIVEETLDKVTRTLIDYAEPPLEETTGKETLATVEGSSAEASAAESSLPSTEQTAEKETVLPQEPTVEPPNLPVEESFESKKIETVEAVAPQEPTVQQPPSEDTSEEAAVKIEEKPVAAEIASEVKQPEEIADKPLEEVAVPEIEDEQKHTFYPEENILEDSRQSMDIGSVPEAIIVTEKVEEAQKSEPTGEPSQVLPTAPAEAEKTEEALKPQEIVTVEKELHEATISGEEEPVLEKVIKKEFLESAEAPAPSKSVEVVPDKDSEEVKAEKETEDTKREIESEKVEKGSPESAVQQELIAPIVQEPTPPSVEALIEELLSEPPKVVAEITAGESFTEAPKAVQEVTVEEPVIEVPKVVTEAPGEEPQVEAPKIVSEVVDDSFKEASDKFATSVDEIISDAKHALETAAAEAENKVEGLAEKVKPETEVKQLVTEEKIEFGWDPQAAPLEEESPTGTHATLFGSSKPKGKAQQGEEELPEASGARDASEEEIVVIQASKLEAVEEPPPLKGESLETAEVSQSEEKPQGLSDIFKSALPESVQKLFSMTKESEEFPLEQKVGEGEISAVEQPSKDPEQKKADEAAVSAVQHDVPEISSAESLVTEVISGITADSEKIISGLVSEKEHMVHITPLEAAESAEGVVEKSVNVQETVEHTHSEDDDFHDVGESKQNGSFYDANGTKSPDELDFEFVH